MTDNLGSFLYDEWPNGGGMVAQAARVDPGVYVGRNSFVHPGVTITGDVRISNSRVYGNSTIDGTTGIGTDLMGADISGNARIEGTCTVVDSRVMGGNIKNSSFHGCTVVNSDLIGTQARNQTFINNEEVIAGSGGVRIRGGQVTLGNVVGGDLHIRHD